MCMHILLLLKEINLSIAYNLSLQHILYLCTTLTTVKILHLIIYIK